MIRSLTMAPTSRMCTIPGCFVCMNAPGISTVATSRRSKASIMEEMSSASVDTVGDAVSDLGMYKRCERF